MMKKPSSPVNKNFKKIVKKNVQQTKVPIKKSSGDAIFPENDSSSDDDTTSILAESLKTKTPNSQESFLKAVNPKDNKNKQQAQEQNSSVRLDTNNTNDQQASTTIKGGNRQQSGYQDEQGSNIHDFRISDASIKANMNALVFSEKQNIKVQITNDIKCNSCGAPIEKRLRAPTMNTTRLQAMKEQVRLADLKVQQKCPSCAQKQDDLQKSASSPFSTTENAKSLSVLQNLTIRKSRVDAPPTNVNLFKTSNKLNQKSFSNASEIMPPETESFRSSITGSNTFKASINFHGQKEPMHHSSLANVMETESQAFSLTSNYDTSSLIELPNQIPLTKTVRTSIGALKALDEENLEQLDKLVKKRKKELEESHSSKDNEESKIEKDAPFDEAESFDGEQEVETSNKQLTINLESVILLENKLCRISDQMKAIKPKEYTMLQNDPEQEAAYQAAFQELVELCEDYWILLRMEIEVFSSVPNKMFDEAWLVKQLKRSFILQMITVSLVGILISNEDFTFQKSYLRNLTQFVHKSYLIFMRILLTKFTTDMLAVNYWARSLEELIRQKFNNHPLNKSDKGSERSRNSLLSDKETISLFEELKQNNSMSVDILKKMCTKSKQIVKDDPDSIYAHVIFATIPDTIKQIDKLTFIDASTQIGSTLREDFSEFDSVYSEKVPESKYEIQATGSKVEKFEGVYLPEKEQDGTKDITLVLDLDETLVHFDENTQEVAKRPYSEEFLFEMAKHFEIVIFTAGTQEYADWVLSLYEYEKCIDYRLYRHHTTLCQGFYVKDLARIGRDLSKVIIVDNIAESFLLQPENGICIKSWYDDPADTALNELAPFLIQVKAQKIEDVRDALGESKKHLLRMIAQGIQNPTKKLPHMSLTSESNSDESSFRLDSKDVSLIKQK